MGWSKHCLVPYSYLNGVGVLTSTDARRSVRFARSELAASMLLTPRGVSEDAEGRIAFLRRFDTGGVLACSVAGPCSARRMLRRRLPVTLLDA
jgi:hypothetical protein|tara:strand:+ start:8952 stop:9230 length:279 start_codon:yes stop_codon:yes gene_type:complete